MGQAKVRKKNGTYPTKQQIAAMEEEQRRWDTKVWYPTANDLPLLHVPEDVRPILRKRLEPWLQNLTHADALQPEYCEPRRIGVQGGKCWEVAQALVTTAKDPNVTLVEGVWIRPYELNEGEQPAPHTWAMVDGYRIDLVGEFYCWRGDCEWLYEPLAEYSYADVRKIFGNGPNDDGLFPEGFDISEIFWWKQHGDDESFFPEHLRSERGPSPKDYGQPTGNYDTNQKEFDRWLESEDYDRWHDVSRKWTKERNNVINSIVFKPAIDRMIAQSRIAA